MKPNPGSDEALALGCTCAVLDNAHGRGFPTSSGLGFWITADCPLHGTVATCPTCGGTGCGDCANEDGGGDR